MRMLVLQGTSAQLDAIDSKVSSAVVLNSLLAIAQVASLTVAMFAKHSKQGGYDLN